MKGCELCRSPARMYCDSDQASLCWDCDAKVHSANFLVSRHSRTLLCSSCQAPTPWQASGTKLCPTISICVHCSESRTGGSNYPTRVRDSSPQMVNDDDIDTDDEYSDDEDADEIEEDEEAENQVVPWSTPLPPAASSTSSDEESSSGRDGDESAQSIAFSSKRAPKSGTNRGFQGGVAAEMIRR